MGILRYFRAGGLIRKSGEIGNLAEGQDISNGAVPACEWGFSDVNDVIAMNREAAGANHTRWIPKVKAVDIGAAG